MRRQFSSANPEGIAGALKRIGAAVFGSRLTSPRAAEISHMYFAEGVSTLFATHPPLPERIRRLDPSWDGKFPKPLTAAAVAGLAGEDAAGFIGEEAALFRPNVPVEVVRHAAEQIGNPSETHRRYAAEPRGRDAAAGGRRGPRTLRRSGRRLCIALGCRPQHPRSATRHAPTFGGAGRYALTLKLLPSVDQLDVRAYLPLVDMTLARCARS